MADTLLGGLFALGESRDEARKRIAWDKASVIPFCNPNQMRRDAYGWIIHWSEYGNRDSPFGWEVDHTLATALGGPDTPGNWRALNCRMNASLGGSLGGLLGR